ncbi:MAG: leucyl aminopeptidase, partial [Nitrospinota bacterium]
MREVLMGAGARKVVETCARLRPGERLLIVTDFERVAIARVLAAAGHAAGAETMVAAMEPRPIDNAEPPAAVAAAMKAADVVLLPVSKAIAHSAATKEALAAGARVLSMTAFTEEQLIGGGIEADFEKEKPRCDRV